MAACAPQAPAAGLVPRRSGRARGAWRAEVMPRSVTGWRPTSPRGSVWTLGEHLWGSSARAVSFGARLDARRIVGTRRGSSARRCVAGGGRHETAQHEESSIPEARVVAGSAPSGARSDVCARRRWGGSPAVARWSRGRELRPRAAWPAARSRAAASEQRTAHRADEPRVREGLTVARSPLWGQHGCDDHDHAGA